MTCDYGIPDNVCTQCHMNVIQWDCVDFMNSPPVKLGWSIVVFCVRHLVFLSLSYSVQLVSHSTFCHPLIWSAVWMWLIPKSCCGRHYIYAGTNQVPIWRFLFLTIAYSSIHQCFIIVMVSQHQKYMYFTLWNLFLHGSKR